MGNSETSMNDEDLSVQIYEIVHKKYPEHSDKITGMILESDTEELRSLLLNNEEELLKRINVAATVVIQSDNKIRLESTRRKINKPDSSDDIDSIGNKLYGIVHQLYPVFAANVTGMLLEMDINRLHNLLNDNNDELMKCIHEAARVYMESQTKNSNLSTNNTHQSSPKSKSDIDATRKPKTEQEDKQTLGEQMYLKVVPMYPEKAAKLTGMLLEMDTESLKETLESSKLFEMKLAEALQVLHTVPPAGTDNIDVLHDLDKKENGVNIDSSNYIDTSSSKEAIELERQNLAEQLYIKIEIKHPSDAPKITGMFLEMDLQSLKELNENSELFNKKLDESIQVLSEVKKYYK